jgi:hypothetical protein
MISLYIKTHNVTGLKYLGKTIKDPHKYKGSGKYWLRHLQLHGNDVSTEVIFQTDDLSEFREIAEYYSELFNVVESSEWANLIVENGSGGDNPLSRTPEAIRKRKETMQKNKKSKGKRVFSDSHRDKISRALLGKLKNPEAIMKSVATRKERYPNLSEEVKIKISKALKGRTVDRSAEHADKILQSVLELNSIKLCCIYCRKEGQFTTMHQFHLAKCKLNPDNTDPFEYPIVCCHHCRKELKLTPNYYRYHGDNCKQNKEIDFDY